MGMDQIPAKPPAARRLKMVGRESMDAMLDIAVSRALGEELAGLGQERLRSMQDRVRQQFRALLRENARTVQGVTKGRFLAEMDSSRKALLKKRAEAEAEMGELQRQTAMLRDLYLVRDTEDSAQAAFEHDLEARFRAMGNAAGPAMRRESYSGELAHAAADLARAEWKRILDSFADNANDEIDQYKRRIDKLSAALEETEQALDAMAKLNEGDPGMASIYRNVRGLREDDGAFALQRRAMLQAMFKRNRELQGYRISS